MATKAGFAPRFLENRAFFAVLAFLVLVFFTGGGSRADIQSLIVLRPAAVLFCGLALLTLRAEHVRRHRFAALMTAAIFAVVMLHMIPLPAAVWGALPGRDPLATVDRAAGLGAVWRPLAMVPSGAANALFSLFVPLAVLLWGVQLSREQRFALLPVLLGLGLLSGLWGMLQAIGDPSGPLYLYRTTNNASAVGLFANRNHQAFLLAMLFPMLAIYASATRKSEDQARFTGWLALGLGAALVPLVLVTGSRAGLLVGVVAIAMATWLYRRPQINTPPKRKGKKLDLRFLLAGFGALCLGALTVILSRAEAVQRLISSDQTEDMRFQLWGPVAAMAWQYLPFGSGVGSFAEVYLIDEPYALLSPKYLNHAHNDWLELLVTAGLPGAILLIIALVAFVRRTIALYRDRTATDRDSLFARLGAAMIVIVMIASLGDYPLRVPTMMAIFVVAVLWSFGNRHDSTTSKKDGTAQYSRLAG